ncbi:MAG: lytic transglycosylase domain-containing protein, partial [Duncaniella sp.]|nr:lytic transglycosylase domain-containing protein [Duncaniella sp.]
SEVINPRIPSKLKFADQTIDLDRTDRWERLDRELTSMVYTHGNTLLAIKRANRYFPMLAPLLQKNGVPSDLIYLAVIESTLNPRALSPAKAGGLWQFMPTTAKEYGLEVNDYVDERYDPVKATEAACRYLKKSYAKYGNWESVAASYNGGVARITNELAAQQVDTAYDLYLADETMRYMFRLLAMKLIMENPKDYGFRLSSDQLYQPLEYTTVEVSTPVEDWPTWAKEHGIDYMTLRENNPWIRAKSLPNKTGKTYLVNVPTKDSMSRARQKKSVYNPAWVTD